MKFSGLILAAVLAITQAAPVLKNLSGSPITGSYIVVLKEGISTASFQDKWDAIVSRQKNARGPVPTIHHKFTSLGGFTGKFSPATLKELAATPEVAFIEQDAVINIYSDWVAASNPLLKRASQDSPPSWGLSRISSVTKDTTGPYEYNDAAGEGVTAYVIDTGINIEHQEFEGRASLGQSFIDGVTAEDDNGHGSHCSGTIAGATYGVAKKANLVAVKVLSGQGSGSTSGVVAGMDWVVSNAQGTKAVASMSLGGSKSTAIDQAAGRLYSAGIPLFAAAGNDASTDACNGSPSGAANTFTVAASDINDKIASFSSRGKCVEIIAPGVDITSAWIGSTDAQNTISGTSMATPHVAGVAALQLSFDSSLTSPQAVFDKLVSISTKGAISGSLKSTPNNLLYNGGSA